MRTRGLIVLLAMSGALALSGCDFGPSIRGSGTVISEARQVQDFTGIQLMGSGKVVIEQSDKESLSVRTDDNLLEHIVTVVEDGTLKLYTKNYVSLNPTAGVTYTLLVKKLNNIGVSGGAEIEANGIHTDSLIVAVSGAGDIKISGETDDVKIAISGAGKLAADGFKSKDAAISISGAGHAVLAVANHLDVEVSGAGDVEYVGNPKVTQKISGAGSVRKRS